MTNHFSPFRSQSIAVPDGSCLETCEVGACARLGQRPRLPVLAARDRSDKPLGLVRGRDFEELARPAIDHRESEAIGRLPGLLLERDLAEHGQVATAERRRHVEHRESGLPGLPPQFVDLRLIERAAPGNDRFERIDLLHQEAADALLQLADVGWKLGDDHGEVPPRTRPDRTVRKTTGDYWTLLERGALDVGQRPRSAGLSIAGDEDGLRLGREPARPRCGSPRAA